MSDGSDGSVNDPDLREATAGVFIRDVQVGSGDPCPPKATVTVNITGWLVNGEVFNDTKADPADPQPITFSLTQVIKGWQEGIPGMKAGGIRKLVVLPEKGLGPIGHPPKVLGNATLIYEIELISFQAPQSDTPNATARQRRTPAPTDLTRLSDGSLPTGADTDLKPVIGAEGLMYRDVKVGDGAVCPVGANVVMDYIGWLAVGGARFDSSWNPNREPLRSSLGGLIKGWQLGVPGMRVGGIRKLVIPAELGYGSRATGSIPPNSTLVFEIELLGIE
jgi:peptidylprolyl isomerase